MSQTLQPRTFRTRSSPSAFERAQTTTPGIVTPDGRRRLNWPIILDSDDEVLLNHFLSPSFRATNPLYMTSQLAARVGTDRHPSVVAIDSHAGLSGSFNTKQNVLYRLAEGSASLAHALMMVSATDLASREEENKAKNRRLAIYHKSGALTLLNDAIENRRSLASLETLATAAVLACHELVVGDHEAWTVHMSGLSRMIAMNNGIDYLAPDHPVRHLIVWADQVGSLLMNTRPLFPASAVFPSSSS